MHEDAAVRRGAERCLASGGPHMMLGRLGVGGMMTAPTINGLADFGGGREANQAEEQLVREAFAAFRTTYEDGLRELIGEDGEAEEKELPEPKEVVHV